MEEATLVMIVSPLMGHMGPALEMAKLLLERNNQISITVLVMKIPTDQENSPRIDSLITAAGTTDRLHFLNLPAPEDTSQWCTTNSSAVFGQLIEYEKPHVREIASKVKNLRGFIVDLVTTSMMNIADEIGASSYMYFTSGISFLTFLLHLEALEDQQNHKISDQLHNTTHLITPSFINPVPISVLPMVISNNEIWSSQFLPYLRSYRKAKGIIVNTFAELEDHALRSFSSDHSAYGKSKLPDIYTVGPLINRFQNSSSEKAWEIIQWLDAQPPSSVVFFCFGSMGSLPLDQIKEVANGIERCGYRFLWSLRQAAIEAGFPREYENYEAVMPEGFLNRTETMGKVVGWVPQLDVLSHPAVGGFVSHCGWNSILESVWCGVPIATWPLSAEQQLNAFQVVKDLGIAVEISLDYHENKENQEIINAERIENGLKKLMDGESEQRKRVKEYSEKSRLAMSQAGSSFLSFQDFIQSI